MDAAGRPDRLDHAQAVDGIDDYGAYYTLRAADYPGLLDFSLPINFIVHRGNEEGPGGQP